jgi:hypothetical protein
MLRSAVSLSNCPSVAFEIIQKTTLLRVNSRDCVQNIPGEKWAKSYCPCAGLIKHHTITRMGEWNGSAITQEVSRRLPTAAARVRSQFRSCGIFGEQSGTGTGFLRVLRFTLPILIPPTAPQSSSIIRGWYNRSVSGRRTKWTQSHPTPRN